MPSTEFVKAFTVIIQFGAILSVLLLSARRFFQTWDFYLKLLIGFLPAAVFGLLFSDHIDALMESVAVVAAMLVLGGIVMLFVDKWFDKPAPNQQMTNRRALVIGLFQCIAMIPGVSRSMATIVGGMTQRLTRKNAAEFSFFLAVPTMFAASSYKLLKLLMNPEAKAVLADNIGILLIGNLVAFVVAMLAIKFFINFVSKFGFRLFGWYRIGVGGLILLLWLLGVNLQI
jgi:undecaprenyl-diphosphatase